MIAACDPLHLRLRNPHGNGVERCIRDGKGIVRALQKQLRRGDCVQMLVSQHVGLARRMQRIGEVHEPRDIHSRSRSHRGHSPAK